MKRFFALLTLLVCAPALAQISNPPTWNPPQPPVPIGTSGQVLTVQPAGTLKFAAASGGTCPAGSTGQVQYNNAGSCAASSAFVFDGISLITVTGIRAVNVLTFGPVSGAGSRPNGFTIDPTTTDFMWCAGAGTLTFSTGATCTGAIGLDMEGSNDFELAGNNSPVFSVRDNGGAAISGARNGVADAGGSPGVSLGINSPIATTCYTFGGSTYPLTTGISECNTLDTINGLPFVMGLNGGVTVAVFNFTEDFLSVGSPTPLKYLDATNAAGSVATTLGDSSAAASATTVQGGSTGGVLLSGGPIQAKAPLESVAGTQFTVASGTGTCATSSTLHGGVQAGDFICTTAGTAASTVTLTLAAAKTAYACWGRDVTTPTTVTQTGVISTTSVTLTLTSVTANNVIQFGCLGY